MKAVRAARQKRQEIQDSLLSSGSCPVSIPTVSSTKAEAGPYVQHEQENMQESLQARMEKEMSRKRERAQVKEQADIQGSLQARMEKQLMMKQQQQRKKPQASSKGLSQGDAGSSSLAAAEKQATAGDSAENSDADCNYLLLNPHETEVFDQVQAKIAKLKERQRARMVRPFLPLSDILALLHSLISFSYTGTGKHESIHLKSASPEVPASQQHR